MTHRLLALVAVLLLAAACGSAEEAGEAGEAEVAETSTPGPAAPEPTGAPEPAPDPADPADPTGSDDPFDEPEPGGAGEHADADAGEHADADADVEPLRGEASTEDREEEAERGGVLAVTDVRVGSHDGFDRVVFELEGDGQPGWFLRYVDEARSAGRGDVIELEGEAVLSVAIHNLTLPPDLPDHIERWDDEHLDGPAGGVVTELRADVLFEGVQAFHIGLTGEQPFLAERFERPTRLVLDIHHDG